MPADRELRVLLVAAATSTTGGGERHVADLLRLLPARGIEVGLVTPPGGDLALLAAHVGIPFHHADIAGGLSMAGRSQIGTAIHTFEPDIVHAHGSRAAFYARLADPKAARRVVYTLHGIHVDKAGSALRQSAFVSAERVLKPRTARFVTVCDSDRRKGARLGILESRRSTTVYNGIEVPSTGSASGTFRAELGVSEGVPLALSIGRFHEQKDQPTLLRAWSLVRERVPAAVLALVGAGELDAELRALAEELGLGDAVRFVAPRPDLAPAYADADIFALSSLWEGLPYVVLEAMSFGVPVVSTGVDGIPEAVADGESGLLVPPGDSNALAGAIVRLLGDPDARARMGEAGAAIVRERFGLERMADELVAVYRSVAAASAASS
ncbi:MAG: glycosyltransferase family 4 protein [Coriobacteriia bacterium]|nr:glycosyltransferase family 4 protein [Coriobacteriia bacterium]